MAESSAFPEHLPPRTKPVGHRSIQRRLRETVRLTISAYKPTGRDKGRRIFMIFLLIAVTLISVFFVIVGGYGWPPLTWYVGPPFWFIGLALDAWAIAVVGTSPGATVLGFHLRRSHLDIFMLVELLLNVAVVIAPARRIWSYDGLGVALVCNIIWWVVGLPMFALAWVLPRPHFDDLSLA